MVNGNCYLKWRDVYHQAICHIQSWRRLSRSGVCRFWSFWCVLTVIDKADRGDRLKTRAHFSSFDLFKTIRQTIKEVLPLLVQAQPQIQLQLSLNGPACMTKALFTRQLWTKIRPAIKWLIIKTSIQQNRIHLLILSTGWIVNALGPEGSILST